MLSTLKIVNLGVRSLSTTAKCLQQAAAAKSGVVDEAFDLEELKKESLFTEDHVSLRRSLRQLIEKDINPYVDEWEEAKIFPAHKIMKLMGSAGYLGVSRPVEYGGLGLDYSYNIAIAEELGSIACGGVPMAIGVQSDMATPALARFGTDELRREYLIPTISGDLVCCLGVSEPEAGSDVANIKTTAKKVGDDFIINGGKLWTTSGMQADWMCCLANTSTEGGYFNKSLIVVPLNSPGVTRARSIDKIGMYCSDTAQIFFEDVRVPQRNLIGEEGQGFVYQMLQFQEERLWGAAASLLPIDIAITETINYCRNRKVFGKPVLDNQVVHFRLAELKTEVELCRSMLYRATAQYIDGNDVTKFASMIKLKTGRLSREAMDSCLQYWGGMGYSSETMISRAFRDSRLLSIGAGADEVMLGIICKLMGTLPKK